MAVRTVKTIWTPNQRPVAAAAMAQPDTAPAIVKAWRKIMKKPHTEGMRRRDRVRKMQEEAAPRRM